MGRNRPSRRSSTSVQQARRFRKDSGIEGHRGKVDRSEQFPRRNHSSSGDPTGPGSSLGLVPAMPVGVFVFSANIPRNEINTRELAGRAHSDFNDPTDNNNIAANSQRAVDSANIFAKGVKNHNLGDNAVNLRTLAANVDGSFLRDNGTKGAKLEDDSTEWAKLKKTTIPDFRGYTDNREAAIRQWVDNNYRRK